MIFSPETDQNLSFYFISFEFKIEKDHFGFVGIINLKSSLNQTSHLFH